MQRAWVEDAVGVAIAPVGEDREEIRVGELLMAAGGVAGRHVGLVDDLGAPGDALLAAFAGPAGPAIAGDERLEVLAEGGEAGALLDGFDDGGVEVGEEVGGLRAGDDERTIMRCVPDVVPALGGQVGLLPEEGELFGERRVVRRPGGRRGVGRHQAAIASASAGGSRGQSSSPHSVASWRGWRSLASRSTSHRPRRSRSV